MSGLLEREAETASLVAALRAAVAGRGALVLVEGAPGVGKTALIGLARDAAQQEGVSVLQARGGALERRYALGVTRQLLGPALASSGRGERAALLRGPAGRAWAILEGSGVGDPDEGSLMHGLYWLMANACERGPLAILVDDAHWADVASLRFLVFLARRLEGLPLAMVVAARHADPDGPQELLDALTSVSGAIVLRPAILGLGAVTTVVARAFAEPVDAGFALACREATRGNPFLLRELLAALTADGVRPTAVAAAHVAKVDVPAVKRAVLMRVGRLSPAAGALARAAAVLGEDADPVKAFALAEVTEDDGAEAAEALIEADVLDARRPLCFSHPLVREAVYRDLGVVRRVALHARAAEVLMASGSEPERVASHLVETPPARMRANVDALRAAARTARSRGSPQTAVAYLRRALEEPPVGAERSAVLRELASVEAVLRLPEAADRLEAALTATQDAHQRAVVAQDLANVLMYSGRSERAEEILERAIDGLGDQDDDLVLRLQTMWGTASLDAGRHGAPAGRIALLRRAAERDVPAALPLRVYLGFRAAMRAEPAGEVRDLVRSGWDRGRLLELESGDSPSLVFVMLAATWIEDLDWAVEICDAALADAQRRASVLAFSAAASHRAVALLRRGDVPGAEADARAGLAVAVDHDLSFTLPFARSYVADALRERGAPREAEDVIAIAVESSVPHTMGAAVALESRGWLRLGQGRRADAAADHDAAGRIRMANGAASPAVASWRRGLALAIAPEQPAEASALLAEELRLARRAGVPGVTALALRAAALADRGERQIELLEQAVATAQTSPAALTRARVDLDLGAALRRAGHRRDARESLRRSLDLASRCGATALATSARQELEATGARPRRERITGRDALTASERRIAEMAAEGLTNRAIAEQLFLTPKTVENHLGRVYLKLGIGSRRDLPDALERETAEP